MNYSLILFLVITIFSPTITLGKTEVAPSIEIVQQENVCDIEIKFPDELYIPDETLDVSVVGKNATLESIFYQDSQLFQEHDVFFNSVKIKAIVTGEVNSTFKIIIDYQSCTKKHECSEVLSFDKEFKVLKSIKVVEQFDNDVKIMEQDSIANMLKDKSLMLTLFTFFGFGLLLAFTPCMLPVIPILSAVIISKQKDMTAKRGFFLSLTYVVSMSLVYAIAGVVAASLGSNIQAFFQQTWIIILFSSFFFILGLAMFGTFNIEMPKRLQSMLVAKSTSTDKRTYFGVILLGTISALIVGPCVAPPLAGALIYISQTGDEVIGGLSLFVMSLGMGIPLLLLGAGAGKFIPKPGAWMEGVKLIFGFVMLGFSLWILSRIVDEEVILLLWGMLFVGASVFMNIFEVRKLSESNLSFQLKKILALFSLIFGIILIVGAIGGAKHMSAPLEPFTAKSMGSGVSKGVVFKTILSNEVDDVINNSSNQLMFIFTADWCDNCKKLDRDVFSKQDIAELLSVFNLYEVDMTANGDEDIKMLKKYGFFGPPGMIFFDKNKKELSTHRLVGYKTKEEFIEHIESVKKLIF